MNKPDTPGVQIRRYAAANLGAVNSAERTVDVCFATQDPIWDGEKYIITPLDSEHCDMSLLNNGAPVYREHNNWEHIGSVVPGTARLDADGKARATLKISRNCEAIFRDIEDGILNQVSVAGCVWGLAREDGDDGATVYKAEFFVPDEISFVRRAADQAARVGRSATKNQQPKTKMQIENNPTPTPAPAEQAKAEVENLQRSFTAIAEQAGLKNPGRLVMRAIAQNKNEREFSGMVADELERSFGGSLRNGDSADSIARAAGDKFKDFSVSRLLRSIAIGSHCPEMELATAKSGRYIIPAAALKRAAVTTTNIAGAIKTTTDNTIESMLRAKSGLIAKMRHIPNLPAGDYDMPVVTTGTTAQGVAEGGSATDSALVISALKAKPNTASCYIELTRATLAKTDAELERVIMEDAFAGLAECIERAALYGTGTNEATGLANTTGVTKTARTSAIPQRTDILALLKTPQALKLSTDASLACSSGTYIDMMGVSVNETAFLVSEETGKVVGKEVTETNLCKDGDIFCGPFAELFLFLWSNDTTGGIEVVREQSAKTGNVGLGFYLDYDVGTRHPEAFAISTAPNA